MSLREGKDCIVGKTDVEGCMELSTGEPQRQVYTHWVRGVYLCGQSATESVTIGETLNGRGETLSWGNTGDVILWTTLASY